MKKALLIILAIIGMNAVAQTGTKRSTQDRKELREKLKDLSAEQRAVLSTKKLALQLDLTEAQQEKIYPLALEIAQQRTERRSQKIRSEKLTKEQFFEMKKKQLDFKATIKGRYKAILTPDQFTKWEHTIRRGSKKKKVKVMRQNN